MHWCYPENLSTSLPRSPRRRRRPDLVLALCARMTHSSVKPRESGVALAHCNFAAPCRRVRTCWAALAVGISVDSLVSTLDTRCAESTIGPRVPQVTPTLTAPRAVLCRCGQLGQHCPCLEGHTQAHTDVDTDTDTDTDTHAHSHARTRTHAHTHSLSLTHPLSLFLSLSHTHTLSHTHSHTPSPPHTRTVLQVVLCKT